MTNITLIKYKLKQKVILYKKELIIFPINLYKEYINSYMMLFVWNKLNNIIKV